MRYLKLFEAYSPNHFWSELDQAEWNDLMDYKKIYFTDQEVEEIRQLTVKLAPDTTTEGRSSNESSDKLYPYGWDITRDYRERILNIHFYVHNISYVTITKIEDEWFGIAESWGMNQQTFYKCDQWTGLIETLKEIFESA